MRREKERDGERDGEREREMDETEREGVRERVERRRDTCARNSVASLAPEWFQIKTNLGLAKISW